MAVIRLAPTASLSHALARLRLGDVLIVGTARIVLQLDTPHGFWVEQGGDVNLVGRGQHIARRVRDVLNR